MENLHTRRQSMKKRESAPAARRQQRILMVLAAAVVLLSTVALPAAADAPPSLARALGSVRIGEPQTRDGLTLFPLLAREVEKIPQPASLEQALERGWLEIVEKNGGTVPEVWVTNRSNRMVFIMGGEILSGARQDRIVQRDLLLSPWCKRLAVPVFCVEEGRWHYTSKSFGSEKVLGTYKLRSKAQAASPTAQEQIWSEVARANENLGVVSGTGAYQDAYRDPKVAVRTDAMEKSCLDLIERHPDAVGVIICFGGRIVSLDLFETPQLFRELWRKILKSTLVAYLGESKKGMATRGEAAGLLRELGKSSYEVRQALDLGIELVSDSAPWSARALIHREALVHLAVFPREPDGRAEVEEGSRIIEQVAPSLVRSIR
jgi:hypothetical protein